MSKIVFLCVRAILIVATFCVCGLYSIGFFLAFTADFPSQADLVVVLGGDDGERYARGRELVLRGLSNRLLLINATEIVLSDAKTGLLGVEVLRDDLPRSTWQEAKATLALMQANGWRTVLVVSDPPHILRMRYTWFSNFRGTGVTYVLVASDPKWWSVWRWWDDPFAVRFVWTEVIKLCYYLVRYRFGYLV